jgi:hypothetical protein
MAAMLSVTLTASAFADPARPSRTWPIDDPGKATVDLGPRGPRTIKGLPVDPRHIGDDDNAPRGKRGP